MSEPERDLGAYLREVQAAKRNLPDSPAPPGSVPVTREQVLGYRGTMTHLDHRLPEASLAKAAWGGLQDSAPRAALMSLHARVAGVQPSSWEHPDLAQIWFRCADYVIPRRDIGVFTIGCMPRVPAYRSALERIAERIVSDPSGLTSNARARATGAGTIVGARSSQVTGRFLIRWDASRTTIIPIDRPVVDAEENRLELCRRFLHWYGPAAVQQFAKWAGLTRSDAEATWGKVEHECTPVSFEGRARSILTKDESHLLAATPLRGVRYLPESDPYLALDQDLFFPGSAKHPMFDHLRQSYDRRLVNSLSGRVVLDGEAVGAWGRVQNKLSLAFFEPVSSQLRDAVLSEGQRMERPIGKTMIVQVLG